MRLQQNSRLPSEATEPGHPRLQSSVDYNDFIPSSKLHASMPPCSMLSTSFKGVLHISPHRGAASPATTASSSEPPFSKPHSCCKNGELRVEPSHQPTNQPTNTHQQTTATIPTTTLVTVNQPSSDQNCIVLPFSIDCPKTTTTQQEPTTTTTSTITATATATTTLLY